MQPDELRAHLSTLESGSNRPATPGTGLAARIAAACWPGGSSDRLERAAREWLRRWHPERAGAELPSCSCAQGRCAVCN